MTSRFLGLDFRPIGLEDKAVLQAHLRRFPQRISGYTFASLAAWTPAFGFEWTRMSDDCLLISRPFGGLGERHLIQPLGFMDPGSCETLLHEAGRLPYPLRLLSVSREFLSAHPDLSARFTSVVDRAGANYLYLASELAELPGRRYAKKRNLIAQFLALHPDWEVTPLDVRCGPECVNILLALARGQGVADDDPSLRAELAALDFTMHHFDALEQRGLMIRVRGEPVAFSVYEPLDAEVTAVHFEKADRAFKGVFQVVNRESARRILASGARIVNREEDLGDEGLRQAKLSYHPLEILPILNLTLLPTTSPRPIS